MISERSRFRLVRRGFKDAIVLVPGWAADYRIFDTLDLNYNYLLPVDFNPAYFEDCLLEFLDAASLSRVSLFGWSQGGFLASDFASQYPEKIDELILLGIRKRYDQRALEEIKLKLTRNKRVFLYKFYLNCFSSGDNEGRAWFKIRLLKKYLDNMSAEQLIDGLDYLSRARIKTEDLSGIKKIRIFHGTEDRIAPFQEAMEIKSCLPAAEFIRIEGAGHILFLNPDFKGKFYG
jgi:pimeloyl-ACP methyl ester carboxylesterase